MRQPPRSLETCLICFNLYNIVLFNDSAFWLANKYYWRFTEPGSYSVWSCHAMYLLLLLAGMSHFICRVEISRARTLIISTRLMRRLLLALLKVRIIYRLTVKSTRTGLNVSHPGCDNATSITTTYILSHYQSKWQERIFCEFNIGHYC